MELYTKSGLTAKVFLDRKQDETKYGVTDFTEENGVVVKLMPRSYKTVLGLLRAAERRGVFVGMKSLGIK